MLSYQSNDQSETNRQVVMIGVGGAGANIIHCFSSPSQANIHMVTMSLDDRLATSAAPHLSYVQLGAKTNRGLGSGGDPAVGADAAQESEVDIIKALKGKDMVVLVAGLGGGTGSGAAPVIARIAKDLGIFLVVVAMMPFHFEGRRRQSQAEISLRELSIYAHVLICFENDHMEHLISDGQGVHEAFQLADQLLAKATACVPMMALSPGLINLGIDELMSLMKDKNSRCLFGAGSARGENRALHVAERVLESPMLSYKNALSYVDSAIVHISGGESLSLPEVRVIMDALHAKLPEDTNIFFGAAIKPKLDDEIRVTLLSSIDRNIELKEMYKLEAKSEDASLLDIDIEAEKELVAKKTLPIKNDAVFDEMPTFASREEPRQTVPAVQPEAEESEPEPSLMEEIAETELIEEEDDAMLRFQPKSEEGAVTEEDSLFAPTSSIQKELFIDPPSKGKFSNLDSTLIDGEDLDLPPHMRQKR